MTDARSDPAGPAIAPILPSVPSRRPGRSCRPRRARQPLRHRPDPLSLPTAPTPPSACRSRRPRADGPPALRFPYDATVLTDAPLRTERLVLRPLEASDAADVFEYQRLPEVIRFLPWPEREREGVRAHGEARRRQGARGRRGFRRARRGVARQPSAGEPAARVIGDMMVRVANTQHAQLEVGWVLHPDFQGRDTRARRRRTGRFHLLDTESAPSDGVPRRAERGIRRPLRTTRHAPRSDHSRRGIQRRRVDRHRDLRHPAARVGGGARGGRSSSALV